MRFAVRRPRHQLVDTFPCGRCEQCMAGHQNRCASNYRYLGAHEHGAYAQFVKLPADHLIPLPASVSFEQAAAFPNAFGTAWHMLIDRGKLLCRRDGAGELRHSGVSMAAIQIAKLAGAHIYATSSADWKLDRAKELGADELINYNRVDFVNEILKRTDKRGVDLVVEHVGGDFWTSRSAASHAEAGLSPSAGRSRTSAQFL